MGHLGPLVLCTRAMNTLHFMEPSTMRTTQVEVKYSGIAPRMIFDPYIVSLPSLMVHMLCAHPVQRCSMHKPCCAST